MGGWNLSDGSALSGLVERTRRMLFHSTELGAINPDVPSFCPCNTEHRNPLSRLGNDKKNVKRITSYSVINLMLMSESNDSFSSLTPELPYCLAQQDFWRPAP